MVDNGRVHPDCPNASNPYHECAVSCLEKIAQGHGRKDKKKSGSFLEASLSFGRKKKGSNSQTNSPQIAPNLYAERKIKVSNTQPTPPQVTTNILPSKAANSFSPKSPVPTKPKVEPQQSQSSSSSSSHQHSEESFPRDHITSSEITPASDNLKPNGSKSLPLDSFTLFAIGNGKLGGSPKAVEDSDDEEVESVVSDSCVSVGKYRVRENAAPILQLILDKYGDIAENCKLESASLRGYYLESICTVVQELQSTAFSQLTKSKVKEFLAVLKDVEAVQIEVSWLRDILNGLTEGVEINSQQQEAEEAKAKCDDQIELMKKELESMVEDLAEKEKAVVDVKARIEETKARLSELELESAKLSEKVLSLGSKAEKFQSKQPIL